jgi:N-methylhydantoinase B
MAKPKVDPFTMEIIKDALVAIGDEMFVALQRTSMSPIIYEVLDYACGLTDHKAQLISQGNGVTGFLGTLASGVQSVLDKFGLDGLVPGDIILQNDPYTGGGTHLSDITQIMPVFYGGQIVAFSVNQGHWTEVGGKDAGSWTTDATEIYQEGLQLPCIKLFKGGEVDQSLVDLIAANVRTPEMTLGDMFAQAASLRLGAKRFQEMCDRYGLELVQAGIEALLDYGEEMTRRELVRLPKGIYEAVDYIDGDGLGNGPFKVCVRVTITDDEFICDFSGTHPQAPGPVNCTRTGLHSGMRTIFKALTDPSIPANEGCFRPLRIICPDRTIFTAERPAPVSTYWETLLYVSDLVWKAMAHIVPDRLPAGHFLSVCGIVPSGNHPDTGELFVMTEPQAGGWGAGHDKDGEDGLVSIADGETYIMPVEVCETRYGLLVDRYGFDICEGGAGRKRGGRGLVRDYRIVADEAWYTCSFGRFKFGPWPMEGGQEGSPNYTQIIFADGREPLVFGKTARLHLKKGDVARLVTGSGGGWGNPYERPVEAVQRDVRDGYISVEMAEKDYGVIVDPTTLKVTGITRERTEHEAGVNG